MTTYAERPTIAAPRQGVQKTSLGSQFVKTITTTDHKRIGYLYLATSFFWFLFAGVLALFIRAELARPGMQFMSVEQYNQQVGAVREGLKERAKLLTETFNSMTNVIGMKRLVAIISTTKKMAIIKSIKLTRKQWSTILKLLVPVAIVVFLLGSCIIFRFVLLQ